MATYYKYSIQKVDKDIATHYKKGALEFDYITPNDFKKIKENSKTKIFGTITLKDASHKHCDVVSITSNDRVYNFELLRKEVSNVKGYLKLYDNVYVSIKNNNYLIIIVVIVLLLLLSIGSFTAMDKFDLFAFFGNNEDMVDNNDPNLDTEKGENITEQKPSTEVGEQGKIEIPGYVDLKVSNDNPEVFLTNPEVNGVYFKYTLKEGDKLIYQTKAFEPGKMVRVNLKNLLSVGEHTLTFIIETYDIETQEPCNGATQDVKILVEE